MQSQSNSPNSGIAANVSVDTNVVVEDSSFGGAFYSTADCSDGPINSPTVVIILSGTSSPSTLLYYIANSTGTLSFTATDVTPGVLAQAMSPSLNSF